MATAARPPKRSSISRGDATYDDAGNLYIVDQLNQRIRRVDTDGMVSTFAGTGERGDAGDGGPASDATFGWADGSNPNPSGGVVHHDGRLFVADTDNHRIRVIDLTSGIIDAFAGTGEPGYLGDGGPVGDAQLNAPRDLEIGPDGDLYLVDTDNGWCVPSISTTTPSARWWARASSGSTKRSNAPPPRRACDARSASRSTLMARCS